MPPTREKRQKGVASVKGQKQQVQWNPNHKFLHLKDGEPIVPFKQLLKGKTGDERRRLLYEIAMDVKEWRRWRHAKAVEKASKRRAKEERRLEADMQQGRSRSAPPKPSTPEERWQQKLRRKREKAAGGGDRSWDRNDKRGSSGRKKLFGK